MPISGKMYVWSERAKSVSEGAGVYALYDESKVLIYLGANRSLRKRFTQYLETNFLEEPCKGGTRFYRREFTSNHEERLRELLEEYREDNGKSPQCNLSQEIVKKEMANEWGFYFYEDIGKPLYEVALNPQEFKKKIREVPTLSLEFHQKRGDFARWIRDVFKDIQLAEAITSVTEGGEDLRGNLLALLNRTEKAACPRCGRETNPIKTWKMAGRPSKKGLRSQLTIGYYKCAKCSKTFRNVIMKEKIRTT